MMLIFPALLGWSHSLPSLAQVLCVQLGHGTAHSVLVMYKDSHGTAPQQAGESTDTS